MAARWHRGKAVSNVSVDSPAFAAFWIFSSLRLSPSAGTTHMLSHTPTTAQFGEAGLWALKEFEEYEDTSEDKTLFEFALTGMAALAAWVKVLDDTGPGPVLTLVQHVRLPSQVIVSRSYYSVQRTTDP
ncbi:hypothetical protein JCM11641_006203 [Rhodosporidiobolus odoratus]